MNNLAMDLELLRQFLSHSIKQEKIFLFLFDESSILNGLAEILINNTLYPVIYYENDLQFRSMVEWAKDDNEETVFCVIMQEGKNEKKLILDYLYRSEQLSITPQSLLNFASGKQWTAAVNWLRGNDFWQCLKVFTRLKAVPGLSVAISEEAYMASALLNIDFSKAFDPASGFIFFFRKMQSERYQLFKKNYPQLAKFVEKKLFSDVPELEEISQDEELIHDFWLGNYEKFSRHLNQPEKNYDLKYQIAIRAPLFVRDQIENVENTCLRKKDAVEKYLQSHLTTDSWDGWMAYIHKEHFLVKPLQIVLQKIVTHLIRDYQYVDFSGIDNPGSILNEHQVTRTERKVNAAAAHPVLQIFKITKQIVEFYQQLKKIQMKIAAADFTVDSLITEIYPDFLADLPGIYAEIKILDSRNQFLSKALINKIGSDLAQIQNVTHSFFVDWIENNYRAKISFLTKTFPQTKYPFQIIPQSKNARPEVPIYILIFDGMRWDGWHLLKPRIFSLFKNRKIELNPVLAPLPTITAACRPFFLTGHFTYKEDWAIIQSVYDYKKVAVHFHQEPADLLAFINQNTTENSLQIINFDLFDRRIHHARLGLKMIYREILQEFEETIEPALSRLPEAALIILFADHGFIQVTGKWFQQLKYDFQPNLPLHHRRFLLIEANKADKKHFIFKSQMELGHGEAENQGLAFLRTPQVFKFTPSESYTRYGHGGISLEEMVVPVVVIRNEK